MKKETLEYLEQLQKDKKYDELIKQIQDLVKEDKRIFTHPFIKNWCALRYRNLFINEAVNYPIALKAANKSIQLFKKDDRSDKQKIAERYLRGEGRKEWTIKMPNPVCPKSYENTTLVFAPGLLTGMLPVRAFQTAFPIVEKKMNIRILRSDTHPMRSCEANVDDLLKTVEKGEGFTSDVKLIKESEKIPPKDFFLICYSKGASDVMNLLVRHPDLKKRVRCIFNWAGSIGGSCLADDIYSSVQNVELPDSSLIDNFIRLYPIINKDGMLRRLDEFDVKGALNSITTSNSKNFLDESKDTLDALDIPFFNIMGSTSVMHVPYFQVQGVMSLNRFNTNNDMQVTYDDARLQIPMATDLSTMIAHHWDMSYDPFPKMMRFGSLHLDHPFPKEAAMIAIIQMATELGLID